MDFNVAFLLISFIMEFYSGGWNSPQVSPENPGTQSQWACVLFKSRQLPPFWHVIPSHLGFKAEIPFYFE